MDAPERTPQGFLRAPAHLTRSGVFVYLNADGSQRREYRPTGEVMRADSLATLISAPVTMDHPPEMVTVANRDKYDRGNVGDSIVRDGGKVAASLYIKDSKLLTAVERGDMREVSCGYNCTLEASPGVVPDGEPDAGQRYDAIQRDIVYNHVAILPRGRAGSEVRLRLDGDGNAVYPTSQEQTMVKERIDGVDYEVGTEPHKAAVSCRDEAAKKAQAERDALQARADKADVDLAAARERLDKLPAELEARATARATLLDGARKVLGSEAKFDGKDDAAIRLEVAAKANPALKLDGKSADYVSALFDMAVSGSAQRVDGIVAVRADALGAGTQQGVVQRGDAISEFARAIEETERAGRDLWLAQGE